MIWKALVCALIVTRFVHAASTWPPQLEMRVPFEPTAFPSDGRTYLTYELYLTNFAANPITLTLSLRRVTFATCSSRLY